MRRLLQAVQNALTDDLLTPYWRENRSNPPRPTEGHCYVAAEALYGLLGGPSSGWKPVCLSAKDAPDFGPHWWLEHRKFGRLDPTSPQYEHTPPYELGRGKGFLTSKPSRRAQLVIDRVKALASQSFSG